MRKPRRRPVGRKHAPAGSAHFAPRAQESRGDHAFRKIACLPGGEALLSALGAPGLHALGQLDQARSSWKHAQKKLRNATLALDAAQLWCRDAKAGIAHQRMALEKERKKALFDLCAVNIEFSERRDKKLRKAFFVAHPEIGQALARSNKAPVHRMAA